MMPKIFGVTVVVVFAATAPVVVMTAVGVRPTVIVGADAPLASRPAAWPAWQIPPRAAFDARQARYAADGRACRVVEGTGTIIVDGRTLTGQLVARLTTVDGAWYLRGVAPALRTTGDIGAHLHSDIVWKITSGSWDEPGPIVLTGAGWGGYRFPLTIHSFRITAEAAVQPALWTDWVYATTLTEAGLDVAPDPAAPMGQCSHDVGPIVWAEDTADRAEADGYLGRFLRMRLRIVGDRFERVAYSSGGDAAHTPAIDALARAPINVGRLLTGLTVECDAATPRGVYTGTWRLGRGIAESGRTAALAPVLQRFVEDTTVDEWNRFRALETLAAILCHQPPHDPDNWNAVTLPLKDVAVGLRRPKLPPCGVTWLEP